LGTFGLIGYPLEHSFSANYFQEKFKVQKLAGYRYINFPLKSIDQFPRLLRERPELRGLNITIPYKEAVIPFLQHLDEVALSIGAVNCIRIDSGICSGFNTDYIGFTQSIKPFITSGQKALVLGTGGSSKAICYALKKMEIPYLKVGRSESADISYEEISTSIAEAYTLWVNCTPLGMSPALNNLPAIPYEVLGKEHLLFDLIYNPAETLFLRKGREAGAMVINGLEMLQIQAEESWKIWNNT